MTEPLPKRTEKCRSLLPPNKLTSSFQSRHNPAGLANAFSHVISMF